MRSKRRGSPRSPVTSFARPRRPCSTRPGSAREIADQLGHAKPSMTTDVFWDAGGEHTSGRRARIVGLKCQIDYEARIHSRSGVEDAQHGSGSMATCGRCWPGPISFMPASQNDLARRPKDDVDPCIHGNLHALPRCRTRSLEPARGPSTGDRVGRRCAMPHNRRGRGERRDVLHACPDRRCAKPTSGRASPAAWTRHTGAGAERGPGRGRRRHLGEHRPAPGPS